MHSDVFIMMRYDIPRVRGLPGAGRFKNSPMGVLWGLEILPIMAELLLPDHPAGARWGPPGGAGHFQCPQMDKLTSREPLSPHIPEHLPGESSKFTQPLGILCLPWPVSPGLVIQLGSDGTARRRDCRVSPLPSSQRQLPRSHGLKFWIKEC